MSDQVEHTVVPVSKSFDLIDPDTPKIEELELEYDEVKANLRVIGELNEKTLSELSQLASSSQHHLVYASLAAMTKAANETQAQIAAVLDRKRDLILRTNKEGESAAGPKVVNNNLTVTSTDILDKILNKNGNT